MIRLIYYSYIYCNNKNKKLCHAMTGRSDDDYKYDNGRHDGKQEDTEKGYADAKRK